MADGIKERKPLWGRKEEKILSSVERKKEEREKRKKKRRGVFIGRPEGSVSWAPQITTPKSLA